MSKKVPDKRAILCDNCLEPAQFEFISAVYEREKNCNKKLIDNSILRMCTDCLCKTIYSKLSKDKKLTTIMKTSVSSPTI